MKNKVPFYKNDKFKDLIIIIFLSLLPCIFLWKLTLSKGVLFGQDVTYQNLPSRFYVAKMLKQNIFPLWSPEILLGFPFFAEGQAGVLYPPNYIFLFLPSYFAYNLSIILHLFLAGLFTYLFIRLLNVDRFSSMLSALGFMFSSTLFSVAHINLINTIIWLPFILYFIELFFKKERFIYLLPVSFLIGIIFFAGHFPTTFRVILVFVVYFLFRSFSLYLKTKKTKILIQSNLFLF